MSCPKTYRYTRDHEWIRVEADIGTIGLTDYAQSQLGDVIFVELPELGQVIEAGKELGVIESVKTASEIYAPVSGEVLEVNGGLKDAPEKVNSDPYGAGWLLQVRLKNPSEIAGLMDATAYQAYVSMPGEES